MFRGGLHMSLNTPPDVSDTVPPCALALCTPPRNMSFLKPRCVPYTVPSCAPSLCTPPRNMSLNPRCVPYTVPPCAYNNLHLVGL